MMRAFHELRRHEEGQALVLAAICMLILTLCVLATVNIAYAADQKIRLQNAADTAAYNTAAFEARAFNFFAYTNRAMVVHYATQMNLMATLSYLIFAFGVYTVLLNLISLIPGMQWVQTILQIMGKALMLLDGLIANAVWALDAVTYFTSLTQFAVAAQMTTRLATLPDEEVAAADPRGRFRVSPVQTAINLLNTFNWARQSVVNALPVPQLNPPSPSDRTAQLDHAIMTEIANSARHEWTAYGGPNSYKSWTLLGIPRHWSWSFGALGFRIRIGKVARTEWGASAPRAGGGFFGTVQRAADQIYSLDRFEFEATILRFGFRFEVNATAWADRAINGSSRFGGHTFGPKIEPKCPRLIPKRVCEAALKPLLTPIEKGVQKALAGMMQLPSYVPLLNHLHFGQMPYAKFRPNPSGNDLFNQQPVLVLANMPSQQLVAGGQPFMNRFGVRIGNLSSGGSPSDRAYRAERNTAASKRGFVNATDFRPTNQGGIPGMDDGLYAMSAALAYYHRPGDWREPPNLFNPFWGAKLMPIADFPQLNRVPVVGQLINRGLFAH